MNLTSFAWVTKRGLAGSGRPGLLGELDDDVAFIKRVGFRMVVNLTQRPSEHDWARDGIASLHFPISDMGIPTPRRLQPVCDEINQSVAAGQPVLVHCRAGLGRTGVVLACCLVGQGMAPADAIQKLRAINRFYIQNATQERFIVHYARFVRRHDAPDVTATRTPLPARGDT